MFFYNNVRRKFEIGIIMDISQNERQSHAAFGSKRLRLRLPLGAKSTESASSLCSANQTPLRPSPSAIAKALPFIGRSCFVEARKAFGFSAKVFSGTAYRPCHLSSSPIRPLFFTAYFGWEPKHKRKVSFEDTFRAQRTRKRVPIALSVG